MSAQPNDEQMMCTTVLLPKSIWTLYKDRALTQKQNVGDAIAFGAKHFALTQHAPLRIIPLAPDIHKRFEQFLLKLLLQRHGPVTVTSNDIVEVLDKQACFVIDGDKQAVIASIGDTKNDTQS